MTEQPAVLIQGLQKRYGKTGAPALAGIDLQIPAGAVLALTGPNGAGKTTLLKILATLILPDAGRAVLFGRDVVRDFRAAKSIVSLAVSEERSFYWRLTGRQNLEFFAALYEIPRAEVKARIRSVTEMFGLDGLDRRYEQYSTGTRHRLALARGFLHEAHILLLDEPTRSLDPAARKHFHELIRRMARECGRTVVLATHDLDEAGMLADRIAVIRSGKIYAEGTPAELTRPGSSVTAFIESACEVTP